MKTQGEEDDHLPRRWSISQGESTQKKPTLSTQRSQTLSLQNCEKILLFKPPSLWWLVMAALEKWILGAISEQSTAQATIYNWIVTVFTSKMSWLPSYLSLLLPLRRNWPLSRRNGLLREAHSKGVVLGGQRGLAVPAGLHYFPAVGFGVGYWTSSFISVLTCKLEVWHLPFRSCFDD